MVPPLGEHNGKIDIASVEFELLECPSSVTYVLVVICQGYDVVDVFHRLCLYTTDPQVRDTLSQTTDLLTDVEHDALVFVHHLESICPHQSFKIAQHLHQQQNR